LLAPDLLVKADPALDSLPKLEERSMVRALLRQV
jgi:hypothetical protein